MNSSAVDLSIVIATLGRPTLRRTLETLNEVQGRPRLEIIVVGHLLDPDTAAFVRQCCATDKSIVHLDVGFPSGDMSRKRNEGANVARAAWIAFIDDDVAVPSTWFLRLSEAFTNPSVGLVSGPSLIPDDLALMPRLAGLALSSPAAGRVADRYLGSDQSPRTCRWSGVIGCNMAFRKEVLEEIGLFDPRFGPGDDLLAGWKVVSKGHHVMIAPAAGLLHYPRATLKGFYRQIHGYGAARVRLIRFGLPIEGSPLVPLIALIVFLGLLLAVPFVRQSLYVVAFGLSAYALVLLFSTARVIGRTRRPEDAWVAFAIPLMHFAYGMGSLLELFSPDTDLSEKPVGA